MAEKLFSLAEAEGLIPKLEEIVTGIIENKKSAVLAGQELAALQDRVRGGDMGVVASEIVNRQTELEFLVSVIQEGLDAIENLGALPKDLDLGLVDFPAEVAGEEVLLCWKYGEKSIQYYHGHTEGFAGRKPLPRELREIKT